MSTTSASDVSPPAGPPGRWRLPWLVNRLGILPFLLLHVACLAAPVTGVNTLGLVLCGACYLVRMFGISAGYHRYFAHRSYRTSRAFQFVLACLGCSAWQKGPLWWAGHHRYHHRHSDTPDDLHSPHTSCFWWSHVGWIITRDHDNTNWQAVRDWSRYPELRWLNRYHWVPGLGLALACFLVGGWVGLVWGFVVSTVLVYHATFAINSLSHLFGRRRYATPDESRNNLVLALLTLGEGWHNNHHHYQSSANQGFFWWEVDVSYYAIRLLGLAGLVWDIRTPPRGKVLGGGENERADLSRPLSEQLREVTASLEERYIRKAMKRSRGNIDHCARICRLSRRGLSARIAEYGIQKSEFQTG